MTKDHSSSHSFREWTSVVINLASNWISLAGVILVTTAGVFWLFLLPTFARGDADNPYIGILLFMLVPAAFFGGLSLMPLGVWLRLKKARRQADWYETLPPVDLRNRSLRRILLFFGVTTFVNVLIGSQLSYRAVHYMDSVTFCGQTCHTVMQPEYAAYQHSPHARVACVDCHIGEGASWFVKSKLSGSWQLIATTFNTYPRPIPTPVANLRPARDTCEQCHWPQKFAPDRLRVRTHFAEDEANTQTKSVLLMRIGGGGRGPGIHQAHLGEGVEIHYRHADAKRQEIPWVESRRPGRKPELFLGSEADKNAVAAMPERVMDCMDCHTRPSHAFELPADAMDRALAGGEISSALPLVKKKGMELLQQSYASHQDASEKIPAGLLNYYEQSHPQVFAQRKAEVEKAGRELLAIYVRNVFPQMKVTWGTYPNHIGHNDFPGCFRCHDERAGSTGRTLTQDCNACHQVLAMEEKDPQILKDLGLAPASD